VPGGRICPFCACVCVTAIEEIKLILIAVTAYSTAFLNAHHRLWKAAERNHYGAGMFPQVRIRTTGCGGQLGTDG